MKRNYSKYRFAAADELWDILQDWKGTDIYSLYETFLAFGEDINSPDFLELVYQYDMMEDLEDWFVDNGGDLTLYDNIGY
tara:strand:- start:776 stop:1015 length:240 start_codon:yes stop_codon:yes gene_type:complete